MASRVVRNWRVHTCAVALVENACKAVSTKCVISRVATFLFVDTGIVILFNLTNFLKQFIIFWVLNTEGTGYKTFVGLYLPA